MQAISFDTDFLPARVARFAIERPDAVALVDSTGPLVWRDLWQWSGRLAAALVAEGVRPGDRVVLALPRCTAFVAAILAVWRVRACYVPLDPALPEARLRWQAEDCGARVVMTGAALTSGALDAVVEGVAADATDATNASIGTDGPRWLPEGVTTLDPQAFRVPDEAVAKVLDTTNASGSETFHHAMSGPSSDDSVLIWPAYVIYTSGSTGRPKGVVLSHAALAAYLQGVSERLPEGIASAAYLSTTAADLGHTSLFGALWHGWTLHLIDADVAADPDAFAAYMHTHSVDLLKIVPSHLDALLQAQSAEWVLPRRCLVLGGEPAPTRLAARIATLRPECQLINHYGPTETAVGVLTRAGAQSRAGTLPLGKPLAHVKARIVDADGNAVPKGATGELCIGGASVAQGYLNRPSLTAERFVPDPDGNGARLYRTGDRSRRLPDGEYAFLGRLDDQVKIRGFRVEPEEVAARLRNEHGVRDAVVIAYADSDGAAPRLVAYLSAAESLDVDAIRSRLAAELPDYMVPSSLQVLAALPLTPNGKIDRAALPAPLQENRAGAARVEPRNDAERTLIGIWKLLLKRDDIGVTDNYFEIGGDSILSLQIIARARGAGLKLTPKQMFDHPTIEAAARVAVPMKVASDHRSAGEKGGGAKQRTSAGSTEQASTTTHIKTSERTRADAGASHTAAYAAATPPHTTHPADDDRWFAEAGVSRDAVDAVYPATPMQQGLLFHGMLDGEPGMYVSQLRLTIDSLKIDTMRAAWDAVIARHPVLRTRFVWPAGGEPLQIVERRVRMPFELHPRDALVVPVPIAALTAAASTDEQYDAAYEGAREAIATRGFEPDVAPLMCVDVFERPDGAHDLLWTHHHALTDGWSTAQVVSEVARAYAALDAGGVPDTSPAAPYADYVHWLRGQPDTAPFWRARLATRDEPARVADALGGALRASSEKSADGVAAQALIRELDGPSHARLTRAARRAQVTLNTLVQAAWALALARFSGRTQVTFGMTVSGRPVDLPNAQSIVGLFINSLPLWVDVKSDATVRSWLAALQRQNAELRDVEHTPLASLQQWANSNVDALFDSLIVFENYPLDDALDALGDVPRIRAVDAHNRSHFPLMLVVAPRHVGGGDALRLEWHRHAASVSEDGGARIAEYFERMLDCLATALVEGDDPHVRLRDLPTDDAPSAKSPRLPSTFVYEPVTAQIAAQARARPEAIALVDGDEHVTYAQLDVWSRAIADELRRLGATAETRVGVAMQRSAALVASLLGVLRAGAAYVPLDPSYPAGRLAHIVDDSQLRLIVTDASSLAQHASLFGSRPTLDAVALRDAVPSDATSDTTDDAGAYPHPQQLAYVIYTSGSTGVPKGVGITHENVARLFDATQSRFAFDAQDVWTLFHSYAFDFSVWEIFGALVHGARLVIVPHWSTREPAAFHALLRKERVTVLNQTPSAFVQLIQTDDGNTLDSLRAVIFGGERLEPSSLARWADGARRKGVLPALVNMYGITETTVHVTHRTLDEAALRDGRSVIGAALDDLTLHVLDADLNRVPVGAVGELYVGGAGLARGYLGRAALSAQRFVPDPYGAPGARLYRSGDLARRLPDGDLEYLGRNDDQVKIRGFRIELGEIQAALRAHPEVQDVAVLVSGHGDDNNANDNRRLIAYVVPRGGPDAGDAGRWQTWLAERLPGHMVPSSYVELERFPLTPNGKLDRRALPAPEVANSSRATYVAPHGETQTKLAAIWQQVLGVERVGAHDDFFLLGGHSLLAVRVLSAVRKEFGDAPGLRAVFEHPRLEDFATLLSAAQSAGADDDALRSASGVAVAADGDAAALSITAAVTAADIARQADVTAPMPLSPSQQSLWFLWKLDPQSVAYHVNGALRFDGQLDVDALRAAFVSLGKRHPALRMRFAEIEGVPYQRIDDACRSEIRLLDLPNTHNDTSEEALAACLGALVRTPFDLSAEPPVRATLVRMADDCHVLHLVLHHIVSDDWSLGLLFADFSRLYRDYCAAGPAASVTSVASIADDERVAATSAAAYRELISARAARLTPERELQQLEWWRAALTNDDESPATLALPYDRTRSGSRCAPGARHRVRVPAGTAYALRALASARRATLFMTLLAAVDALLYRCSGQSDIRLGVPLAGRDLPGAADVAGFFVNTVVIRTAPRGETRAAQLIDDVRERLLGAYANQDVPFASVVKAVQPARDLAQTPLFQVLVNQQQRHDLAASFGEGLRVTVQEVDNGEAQFDLMLNIAEAADGAIDLAFTYATDVFDASTIERLARNFTGLLEQWSAAPDARIASFELPELGDQLPSRLPSTFAYEPVTARIAAQARARPEAIALIDGDEHVTYAQLDAWSRAIADELRRLGATAETRVGVAMQRSAALVASLLGVLRAGAAYVPLDPSYPAGRLAHILDDAQLRLIVTDASSLAQHASLFGSRPTVDAVALRDAVPADATDDAGAYPHPQQLAYVIYTSGSTGVPKGVGVTHENVARLFDATQSRFAFDAQDVWTLFHSYAFDFSVWEMFGALVHGARLVIVPHWSAREPAAFHALLRKEQVTVLNQTPSAFVQLIQTDDGNTLDSLRAVIFGGERLEPSLLARWAEGARRKGTLPALVNMYGITETTVHVTHRTLDEAALRDGRSVIGAPLADLTLHVLDVDLNRVPVGAVGELYVGGAGLARGYLGRAALSAQRFVPDPYGGPGARLYRSGDLARRLPDGDLEYLGRNDDQVKIRGFRIELGEIQAALRAHPEVRDVAVLVLGHGDDNNANDNRRLIAYVVPRGGPDAGDAGRWQTWLAARLPGHMVPSSYVELERFPLTPNGKLDRRALPAPGAVANAKQGVAASTPAEAALLAVWRAVLRRDDIGVTDNFFVIGGDSILSLQIVAKARDAGLHVTPRMVFEAPTVQQLARAAGPVPASASASLAGIGSSAGTSASASSDLWRALGITPEHVEDVYPATPLQSGLLYHTLAESQQGAYLNQMRATLSGTLDVAAMHAAWQAALARHAILRTGFAWQHGGSVMQIVHRSIALPFETHDWSAAPDYDARLADWRARDLADGIAPDEAPLMRIALFIRDARTADLVWTHHHLLLDGWSVSLLFAEILRDYRLRTSGAAATFEQAPPYRGYVEWIREAADDPATEAWWRAWAARADDPATLTASLGEPRAAEPGAHARRCALDEALVSRLHATVRRHEITLNTLMQGAWAVLLARYGHRRQVSYGTTLSGRPAHLPGVERMLGLFINTLPVQVDVDASADLGAWLHKLQGELMELRHYEHTPLARVQQWSGRSGDALFDSIVVFENYPVDAARDGDASLKVESIDSVDPTHYPLALAIIPRGKTLSLEWAWNGERIDRETVEQIALQYEAILTQMAGDVARRVGSLTLPGRYEAAPLQRYAFESLGMALAAQAKRSPDAIALRCEDESLTYAELDAWSAKLAARLVARGVGAERRVGLCVARGPALVAALLGIIRSGGAFVPLDPEYPPARLAQMIDDAGIVQVVADSASAKQVGAVLAGCEVVEVGDAVLATQPDDDASAETATAAPHFLDAPLHPDQLAYVLYTSGSTGRPKGVGVSHGALWTHLQDFLATYGIDGTDTVLHSSTINFDVALHETLPALLRGATVEMRGTQPWDLQSLSERLVKRRVTFARIPTALWQQWQRHAPPRAQLALRQVTVGGEALPGDALARWREGPLADIRLDNLYGPTETTVAALYRRTGADDARQVTVPIGHPYPGRTARVFDAFGDEAPVGGLGELCIGGPTVARGYPGRAALTAERFVPDPYGEPGARVYRSGDLCRLRADGTVEFLGRLDQQVKLRGQRIELGEIEAVLRQCDGVREAAVIVVGEAQKQRLAAYVAGQSDAASLPPLDAQRLQRELEQKLPGYMVPSSITVLARLPWMPNGKLDRASLPTPQAGAIERVAPSNGVEAALLSIWAAVLGRDDLGVTDNFFEAGGDSIQSLQIIARAREAGWRLTPRQMFEHPTVAGLAQRAQRLDAGAVEEFDDGAALPLTPIQRLFFERYPQGESHWNQAVLLKVKGRLVPAALERAVAALEARHDALRLRFAREAGEWKQVAVKGAQTSEMSAQMSEASQAAQTSQPSQSASTAVVHHDHLASLARLTAACDRIQSSLNIEHGPVWRIGHFETPDETRVLIAIHHLAVDGVSWRVLLEELQTAYEQAERDAPIALPAPSMSWRAWVRALEQYSHSDAVQSEASWWQNALSVLDEASELPLRAPAGTRVAGSETIDWTLDASRTRDLLQNASRAYRTRVDELLLAALAQALGAWSGAAEIAVELEGHGREDVIDGVDLSRTVGWFTTRFPVALPGAPAAPGDALVAAKERVRAVPHKGMHWGLLDASRARPRPAISFNYLGRFDQSFDAASRFTFSSDDAGSSHGPGARVDYALDLNGIVTGDTLLLRWRFDPARIARESVERIVAAFDQHVDALIAHCVAAPPGATASDFPLSGLDQVQLRALRLPLGGVADIYPATPLQQGLLYHSELQQGEGVYVNQLLLTLGGRLDAAALRAAWQAAIARHDMLRTRFEWRHGEAALQIVQREAVLPFAVHDWCDAHDYDARLATWRAADIAAGIDASRAPLMRVNVFRRPDGRFDLVRTHHHVLTDGWSGARLLAEVFDDYERALGVSPTDGARAAAGMPPSYRRYVEWLAVQPDPRDWWSERLPATDDTGTLTASLVAPLGTDSSEAASVPRKLTLELDAPLDARVRRAAQRHRVTLNTLMQGAWAALLARVSGKRTVAFGVTVSGRPASLAGSDKMFGLFINSLPVFAAVPGEVTIPAWLDELQTCNMQMREVEHTPLSSLQQWAGRSGDALFDSLIVFENYPVAARAASTATDALRVERVDSFERTHYPLTLTILPATRIELQWQWDSRRLTRTQVEQLQRQYLGLLDQLADDGEHAPRFVGELAVRRGAPHAEPLPEAAPLAWHERFAAEAARMPHRIAVRQNGEAFDYATLARWSATIDARLRASGVAREECVAVCMRRSPALIASMLGVWRSGAAYVPLDPSFPAERLAAMLDDARITRVIADEEGRARLGSALDGRIDVNGGIGAEVGAAGVPDAVVGKAATVPPPVLPCTGSELAYVIYTSGSTGRPKGVAVSHGALARLLASVDIVMRIDKDDVLLSVTTPSFDISLLEFCLPLMKGACVEMADAATVADGAALARLIDESGASVMQATPSGWRLLIESGWRGASRGRLTGIAGGEPLPADLTVQLAQRGVDLWNLYGPTETTIWSTCARAPQGGAVTIGRALHANALRIVDATGQLTPQGGVGELCIGGDNLARGYLGRAGLTAERFVPDPYGPPGARMYRTGDLCRERPDGEVECLGRIDQQVKLRGYRIELGEIEAALRDFTGVLDAAVALVPGAGDAEARLVGYVVGQSSAVPAGWHQTLAARLPGYMVPAALYQIDALPRTANGKLDRNALARFEVSPQREAQWAEPSGEIEVLTARLFGDVLGLARVGADDDFFALGGHSLAAVRLIARLSEQLGRKVALAALFDSPTPRLLAQLLTDVVDGNPQVDVSPGKTASDELQALDGLFDALD
ncbi:amino acid adenylation domain-containing protein (plasmid) [Paraburkholderia strydomiana]